MEAFLVSGVTIAMAEIGDRTQLLSLVLVMRFRKPLPIIAGILCATLANPAAAGLVGVWVGNLFRPKVLDILVAVSMMAMALWTLKPDTLDEATAAVTAASAFFATVSGFFVAEMGDKTQIATVALAAAYPGLAFVVAGTTLGMLAANVPVVLLGHAFADRLPLKTIHFAASALFLIVGAVFLCRALWR